MGMYDIVKVSGTMLPVGPVIRNRIKKEKTEWQTKDLDNSLSQLRITNKGRLIETIGDEKADLDFHGIFEFHSNVGKTWYSFLAKFTDGKLTGIVRLKKGLKYTWPPKPLNSFLKNENTSDKQKKKQTD
ncbi:MAG: hypothetical protein JXB34_10945 [Bacteroidales bacterium]|nr:hypothetical protein [Bacteroidales bacterium]